MEFFIFGFAYGSIITSAVFIWSLGNEFYKDEKAKRIRDDHEDARMREEHRIELQTRMDETLMEYKEELRKNHAGVAPLSQSNTARWLAGPA